MPANPLAVLERLRLAYGPGASAAKLAALRGLQRQRLGTARAVARLHEALCFLRAYPDDEAILAQVQAMLDGFRGGPLHELPGRARPRPARTVAGVGARARGSGTALLARDRTPRHPGPGEADRGCRLCTGS